MSKYNVDKFAAVVGEKAEKSKTVRVCISGDDLLFIQEFAAATKTRRLGDAVLLLITACRKSATIK